jgi:CxxC motif-containing protein (DUF1111 family)
MATAATAQVDPGPRGGPPGAGGPFPALDANERAFFLGAQEKFREVNSVSGGIAGESGVGLGPTFNLNSCAGCHSEPATGGASPHPRLGFVRRANPEVAMASLDRRPGRHQAVPSFVHADGPVREARFIHGPDGSLDGSVHALYTISGRVDAPGCDRAQPDFATQLANHNVVFRIPTPTFGLGLLENVSDDVLVANLANRSALKHGLGIFGRLNRNGNDQTVTRFGWKAQNKSLLIFAGEAYNVEQGVSNENFPNERNTAPGCEFNPTPEDSTNIVNPDPPGGTTGTANQMSSDVVNFAAFKRLLAPPTPTTASSSELHGRALFGTSADPGVGCVLCHTDTLVTATSPFTGMGGVNIHPLSDIAIHHLGPRLADHVNQGLAGPDEFRTAPLWGVGQRIFFLHDGRAGPGNGGLLTAILDHKSSIPNCRTAALSPTGVPLDSSGVACHSEANQVVTRFQNLSASDKQDILNFLRSL